jgi:hypothetical protein
MEKYVSRTYRDGNSTFKAVPSEGQIKNLIHCLKSARTRNMQNSTDFLKQQYFSFCTVEEIRLSYVHQESFRI